MDKAEEKIIKAAAFIRLFAAQRESERTFYFYLLFIDRLYYYI